jgi:hypothetical protein
MTTLNDPTQAIVDPSFSNIYVSDTGNHRVRVISLIGGAGTDFGPFAGDGTPCTPSTDQCGDGGPASAAHLTSPAGMAFDNLGNVYVADTASNRVRKISPSGRISTYVGTGDACASPTDACGDGGFAPYAQLNGPKGLWWTGTSLLIADAGDNRIRKVTVTSDNAPDTITTVAGTGNAGNSGDGAAATSADLNDPEAVLRVDDNDVYVSDTGNHRVRVFALGGNIAAFAGTGAQGNAGDGGAATAATLDSPRGLGFDSGTLYIADTAENRIRGVNGGTINNALGDASGAQATYGGDGGNATGAGMDTVLGLAWDASSNSLYVTQTDHGSRVRKIHAGVITTVAGDDGTGDGANGHFLGDGGQATDARLSEPQGVAVDGSGNVYVADTGNERVRKIDVNTGVISTYAGTGEASFGDGSTPTDAQFRGADGIARDGSGNTWVADGSNKRVREIAADGTVTSVGTGSGSTFEGNGGNALDGTFQSVNAVARDSNGVVYVAEGLEGVVRRITPDGQIETVAGNGVQADSGDGDNATNASLDYPESLAIDGSNNVYIGTLGHRIRKLTVSTGLISTYGGDGSVCTNDDLCGDGGGATSGQLTANAMAFDVNGNLFIADTNDDRVREIDNGGNLATFAGTGLPGSSGDTGPAVDAKLNHPTAIAVDNANAYVYIADQLNHKVRMVDSDDISTVVGTGVDGNTGDGDVATSATLGTVNGLAVNGIDGRLYISDSEFNRIREVVRLNIYNLSGDVGGASGEAGDGYRYDDAGVRYASPSGLFFAGWGVTDPSLGELYVVDNDNHLIRAIAFDNVEVFTFAGGGSQRSGDGSTPDAIQFDDPVDVAMDNSDVLVADHGENRIRRISGGVVSTVAGTGGQCPDSTQACGDGGVAWLANLAKPSGVAVDGSDNVYISDTNDNRVRMVDPNTDNISTVVGDGTACGAPAGGCGDGGAATSAHLSHPIGVTVHGGDIYIADKDDFRVRKVHAGTISTVAGDGINGGGGDGGDATAAQISCPTRLAFNSTGDLFITEGCGERKIRRVDHNTGHISTVAGLSDDGIGGDLGGAVGAHFDDLGGIVFDGSDNLYAVAPSGENLVSRIRKIVGPL